MLWGPELGVKKIVEKSVDWVLLDTLWGLKELRTTRSERRDHSKAGGEKGPATRQPKLSSIRTAGDKKSPF